jgi:hypothetical protein
MICYIPGCIGNGSENFGLESPHVGFAGATPQFYFVAPYWFDYRLREGYETNVYVYIYMCVCVCVYTAENYHVSCSTLESAIAISYV